MLKFISKMLPRLQFLHETLFSYKYTLATDFSKLLSVKQHVIYMNLAKGENVLGGKVAKLPINSEIAGSLM